MAIVFVGRTIVANAVDKLNEYREQHLHQQKEEKMVKSRMVRFIRCDDAFF
jgi:hypothetical protein